MCGRFIVKTDLDSIQRQFDIDQVDTIVKPNYNIAPSTQIITVVQRNSKNFLQAMRWGLVPAWAKDESIGDRMINARAEGIADKPSFKRPLRSQRCLIVADGFYEWRKVGAAKTPMFIHLKSEQPFGFAGIYEVWKPAEGKEVMSCAIITTTPNELMQTIHNRMPVILAPSAHKTWLDVSKQDPAELLQLLKPYPAEEMEAYAVSRLVNSPKNNSPECIRPLAV